MSALTPAARLARIPLALDSGPPCSARALQRPDAKLPCAIRACTVLGLQVAN